MFRTVHNPIMRPHGDYCFFAVLGAHPDTMQQLQSLHVPNPKQAGAVTSSTAMKKETTSFYTPAKPSWYAGLQVVHFATRTVSYSQEAPISVPLSPRMVGLFGFFL